MILVKETDSSIFLKKIKRSMFSSTIAIPEAAIWVWFPACSYFQNPLGKVWWIVCTLIGNRNLIIMLSLRSVLYISSLLCLIELVWLWNEFWCLSWHGVYTICIHSCADSEGGGGQGVRSPPRKLQKYMVPLKLFLHVAILVRTPLKSQIYQSSIQCWAIIGPPAKRHLKWHFAGGPLVTR